MHDKLVSDIETLNGRRESIKAKVAVAKTQEQVNEVTSASDKAEGAMSAFARMEAKADQMLDQANAMSELTPSLPIPPPTLRRSTPKPATPNRWMPSLRSSRRRWVCSIDKLPGAAPSPCHPTNRSCAIVEPTVH